MLFCAPGFWSRKGLRYSNEKLREGAERESLRNLFSSLGVQPPSRGLASAAVRVAPFSVPP
jgi:hypothetical protein